jgi:chemotaxis signal transduction protein
MHVVVWAAAGQHYAVDVGPIVEIIPLVEARPIPQTDPWIRGLINYRGRLIPLLDMASLLGNSPCPPRMACRILVVRARPPEETLVGLAIEQLIGVEPLDFTAAAAHPGLSAAKADYLGPVAWTEQTAVQLVYPERLPGWEEKQMPNDERDGRLP